MLIESAIGFWARKLVGRYLTFDQHPPAAPPSPDAGKRYLLYVHVPFCESLCRFCSFNRVEFDLDLADAYFRALSVELRAYHSLGYCFDVVYFGGGTPTVSPPHLSDTIALIRELWPIRQISVETNPNHLTPEIVALLEAGGVSRLSVGVQSFDDGILDGIGRLQRYGSGRDIRDRLAEVSGAFDTVNVDMIFNFPFQTEQMLREDLRMIEGSGVSQVTYYPLMPSVGKARELAAAGGALDFRRERRFYDLICGELSGTYGQDSVWSFSKKGGMIDEYIIDHDEYAAVGPGSFGYVNGIMYSYTFSVQRYIDILGRGSMPVTSDRQYSRSEQLRYDFLIKLLEGDLDLAYLKRKYGPDYWFPAFLEWGLLMAAGGLRLRRGRLALTKRGYYYWIVVLRTLFSMAGTYREERMERD